MSGEESEVLLDKGRIAYSKGDHQESENHFLDALANGADESVCRIHLARIYNTTHQWRCALEHWLWLRDRDPSKLEPNLQVARALHRLDRPEEAVAGFRAVLTLDPSHAEARTRLDEIEGAARLAPLKAGIKAFRDGDYDTSREHFLQALDAKVDESACHQHLARIYNHEQDWTRALQHWQWLQSREPRKVEPHLQIGRIYFRDNKYVEARLAFNAVLRLEPGHVEALQFLTRIEELRREETFLTGAEQQSNWLSLVPPSQRWPLSTDLLHASVESIESLIDLALRQTVALSQFVDDYADAEGELSGHRRLYGEQGSAKLKELHKQLQTARKSIRAVSKRTDRLFEAFAKFSGQSIGASPTVRQPVARSSWRETLVKIALEVYQEHGLKATIAWLMREALVEDRQIVFSELATLLRERDPDAVLRLLWLSYGAKPGPEMAERLASRMFQMGDLSNAAALVRGAPSGTNSPFVVEMRSSSALFRNGLQIPPRSVAPPPGSRIAYVASGSLPYQVVGYTTRTHDILTGLVREGVDCLCFTRPGFPWDRPRAVASGAPLTETQRVGEVTYIHTPLSRATTNPELMISEAAGLLERHFRAHGIGLVQAASNSRNALPALIAARRTGAKFIYEVRGLWELTAASRFAGWEETERFKLDRQLEVLAATEADHVLTITNGVAEELISSGVSSERLSLLPNAVDPTAFKPLVKDQALMARLGLDANDFTSVYAGSLVNYEGLDDLIVAISLLRRNGIPARAVIAGDGAFRPRLEAVSAEHGLSQAITFVGRVKPDEIESYLSLSDVVPIPRKPFKVCMVVSPLKPFEAMAMAKPVILTDLPALREIVQDGETGLLCKPADPTNLAAVLARLARDPDLRNRLGSKARHWVVENRTWAKNALRLKQLYEQILGEAPKVAA